MPGAAKGTNINKSLTMNIAYQEELMRKVSLLLTYAAIFALCVGLTVAGALAAKEYPGLFSSPTSRVASREIRNARTLILLNNLRTLLLTSVPCAGILIGLWSVFMTGVVLGTKTKMGLTSVAAAILCRPHAILEYSAHTLVLSENLLLSVGVMVKGRPVRRKEAARYLTAITAGALMLAIAALLEIP